tara:strand:- start:272 stop:589 length:318 start_codon:yes stop_codon:yes gene_type:complete
MTETRFLLALSKTLKAYKWEIVKNRIVGVARNGKTKGLRFDPVTAICRSKGQGTFTDTIRGRKKAAVKIGVNSCMLKNLEDAVVAKSNRGHSQTLRGKIRQTLDI